MVSKTVCCCRANTWVIIIGWLQIIFTGIYFLYIFGATLSITSNLQKDEPDASSEALKWIVVVLAVTFCFLIVGFATGIVLIKGANHGNATYLLVWMVLEMIFLPLAISGFLFLLLKAGIILFPTLVYIPIVLFGIWVVNVHRKELLKNRLPPVGEEN